MKALSIRQPWAWLIVRPDFVGDLRKAAIYEREIKDIENRSWPTSYRGEFLIHAAKGMTKNEYENCDDPLWSVGGPTIGLPDMGELPRGGIVGIATLIDCVPSHRRESWWHNEGCFGFRLENARPLPFIPYKGQLGFFDVPDSLLLGHGSKVVAYE